MVVRKAAVAGSFYPRYKPDLINILKESFINTEFGPGEEPVTLNQDQRTIVGGVSPHAGYIYSGCCAAFTYFNVFKERIPDTVIVLGTDHIGYGKIALMDEGEWETPLGNISIDGELSKKILEYSDIIKNDESAFIGYPFGREHNIEVQLPFIKYCSQEKDIKFIPIIISTKDLNTLNRISNDISKAIDSFDKDIVIIASSDMTHKEIHDSKQLMQFKQIDQKVIEAFNDLNPEKVIETASKTTVCGPQTIASLILISKNLNVSKGKLLQYYTSSEKTGNISGYCVGYFSGILVK